MTADHLDAVALRRRVLAAGSGWTSLDVVAETGSTNADLVARAAGGQPIAGAVLITEHQTAGRGRQGRTWTDARAQIAMSVGVDADGVPTEQWGWLPLAAGVSIVAAVGRLTGADVVLKWPNDVLAGGRKLAGILAEVASPQRAIVVGIGLNVTLRPGEADAPLAISVAELGAQPVDRAELVAAILDEFGALVRAWRESSGADARLRSEYRAACSTLGALVRAHLPGDREVVGVASDVDEQGRLCIRTDTEGTGGQVVLSAGDVVHLRPAGG